MKAILHLIGCCLLLNISLAQSVFESDNALNDYAFSRTNLKSTTTGYLLDFESDYALIDSCLESYANKKEYSTTDLMQQFCLLERTNVDHSFEKDAILFPVLDYYYSLSESKSVDLPLFILSNDFSKLTKENQEKIRSWKSEHAFPGFNAQDFTKLDLFCAGFFSNNTVSKEEINIYWNENTVVSNQKKRISGITLLNGKQPYELVKNERINIFKLLGKSVIKQLNLEVRFDDHSLKRISILCDFKTQVEKRSPSFFYDDAGVIGENPTLEYRTIYGCGKEKKMDKPYILVAGWGPFTDKPIINNDQNWPSSFEDLYAQFNRFGFIENLLNEGFDVVISKFSPPNADINLNAERLSRLITQVNQSKFSNGSYQENIVQGYSAGALCARLTLQKMEKAHLDNNGPHPHTKLFVSFDGENAGANIPIGVQKAVEYLEEYEMNSFNFKIYALHYILNAPLSKQLLKYFHTELGTANNPGQGHHPMRSFYMWEHGYANHTKNTHLPNYPSFTRNVSISNGSHKSTISNGTSDHFPFPPIEEQILFEQNNWNRKWKVTFTKAGGNQVFYYKKKSHGVWYVEMGGNTNAQCLILDNAPGGTMFIEANPLPQVIDQMNKEIIGSATIFEPSTLFAFTPTLLTHDIRNFNPAFSGGRMEYDMREQGFMYNNEIDVGESVSASLFFGYPHLSKPNSHYWELTPFDAVFSASINTEHLLSNEAEYHSNADILERWKPKASPMGGIIKNFIMDESDYYHAFIQNKQYGWYARSNYRYRADIVVPKQILAGNHITQRTDFKDVEVLSNATVTFKAGESIELKAGFTVKPGGIFHALIDGESCTQNKRQRGLNLDHIQDDELDSNTSSEALIESFHTTLLVYPNPNQGSFTLKLVDELGREQQFSEDAQFTLFNHQGVSLASGLLSEKNFKGLAVGLYIIQIQTNYETFTAKIIVQ
jgi:hypothetical protein